MPNTISASAMRDRLLARVQAPRANDDWVRVLGIPGHRDLLGLIARHNPPSIGALADLAARAQPNVSRALTALVAAGLVEIVSSGRRSIPRITDTGATKARELGLYNSDEGVATPSLSADDLFSVEIAESTAAELSSDNIEGQLTSWLWLASSRERAAARTEGDLDALGRKLLANWWRILYRRDAPFRLWEFTLEEMPGEDFGLIATVRGASIVLQARASNNRMLDLEKGSRVFSVSAFEQHLIDEFLRPLASHHRLKGRSSRPLHALLQRIEDSRGHPTERAFCCTAGALGVTPHDLSDERAQQIRDLLALIADEPARLDFSSAVLIESLGEGLLWTTQELKRFRNRNAMPALTQLRGACASDYSAAGRPYRHGYALARSARKCLGLDEDEPVKGIEGLSKLLGAGGGIGLSPKAPGTLRAFQDSEGEVPSFVVEDEGPRTSVFTLARGVGDFIAFGSRTSCVANLYTDRQAVGRAFAAEFLAPQNAVIHMMEEEDLPKSKIADHFGVSISVIDRQHENAFN
ncbi:MarR family transcriptional regulator [Pinisolibacter sp. B13]|nr:MarR family transcriptional regulator [Pinisolibacter aquiterrae]MBV5265090.1 MarR family transcriptional regulator [Pinisolibacter aquiterrae]MCC8235580.1 MarR family transcriptional regulator [Pinisolibacter aquiterrae]